jgi:hypothetical protein
LFLIGSCSLTISRPNTAIANLSRCRHYRGTETNRAPLVEHPPPSRIDAQPLRVRLVDAYALVHPADCGSAIATDGFIVRQRKCGERSERTLVLGKFLKMLNEVQILAHEQRRCSNEQRLVNALILEASVVSIHATHRSSNHPNSFSGNRWESLITLFYDDNSKACFAPWCQKACSFRASETTALDNLPERYPPGQFLRRWHKNPVI